MFLLRRSTPRVTVAQLLADAEHQIAQGTPRQDICHHWLTQNRSLLTPEEFHAYEEAERQLFGEMVARNQRAAAHEQAGRLTEALAEYEANVRDKFVGEVPYQRLQALYLAHGDYDNALRVSRAYTAQLGRFRRPITWENDADDSYAPPPRLRIIQTRSA